QDFSEILDWLTSQKDIQVLSIDQTISLIDDLSARRFINYNSYLNLRLSDSINLPFLRKLCLSGVYFSPRTVADLRVKILIYLCLCYLFLGGAAAVIAFQVGSTVLSRLKSKLSIYINGGGVLVILIIFVTLRDLKVNYREALIFVSSFGAYVGLWWALRRSASRREKY
ncbi:MAG: hypothetical protein U9N73_11620, partial [Candidatus Auribacterota bacterium]|nr:hypothetical protein [Candidatus Auribacterota bacterium]